MTFEPERTLIETHCGKPWCTWPDQPDPYMLLMGKYLPSIDDIKNAYPNYSNDEVEIVFDIYQREQSDLYSLLKRLVEADSHCPAGLNWDNLWSKLSFLTGIKDIAKIKRKVYLMVANTIKTIKKIYKKQITNDDIDKVKTALNFIVDFIAHDSGTLFSQRNINDGTELMLSPNSLFPTKKRNLTGNIWSVSNFLDDLDGTASLLGVDDPEYFKFTVEETFPSLPAMLLKMADTLEQIKKNSPTVKQFNAENREPQAFCRLMVFQMRKQYGRPCYNAVSQIAGFIYDDYLGMGIDEDYVKQTCRSGINDSGLTMKSDMEVLAGYYSKLKK